MARIIALAVLVTSAAFATFSEDTLISALFLGVSSAALSVVYFLFGAKTAGLIEISLGAGLTTVLFVFTITLSGARLSTRLAPSSMRVLGRWLALTIMAILGYSVVAQGSSAIETPAVALNDSTVSSLLWGSRIADLWVLVFIVVTTGIGIASLFRPGGASR